MKKSLLGLLSLLVIGTVAQAAPLRSDVRLQYKQIPNRHLMGSRTTTISVLGNGQVVQTFQAALPMPIRSRIIARLDAYQMDRIERLIDRARRGRIVTNHTEIRCLAISQFTDNFSADNGRVFLQKSAMCEDSTVNQSLAAKKLVQILQGLRRQAGVN